MAKQWQHSEQCLPLRPYSLSFILMAFCPPSAKFQQWLSHPRISRTLECKWPYIGSRNLMHWSICTLRVRLQTSVNVTPHVYAFWLTEARTVSISLARAEFSITTLSLLNSRNQACGWSPFITCVDRLCELQSRNAMHSLRKTLSTYPLALG